MKVNANFGALTDGARFASAGPSNKMANFSGGVISGDPHWDKVVLLLNMEDVGITDASPSQHVTVANEGTWFLGGKFGSYSAWWSTNEKLTYTDKPADFQFGTGDYTIETWVKQTASRAFGVLMSSPNFATANNNWILQANNGQIGYSTLVGAGSAIDLGLSAATALTDDVWTHIAISHISGVSELFIAGISKGTIADTRNMNDTGGIIIGEYEQSQGQWFNGLQDEIRITKGVGRYTTNFTPPIEAFPSN
tara:strand:+ start:3637 stop:4389 length:753 start_codon:yes stop_codon:yes gene_type:complete